MGTTPEGGLGRRPRRPSVMDAAGAAEMGGTRKPRQQLIWRPINRSANQDAPTISKGKRMDRLAGRRQRVGSGLAWAGESQTRWLLLCWGVCSHTHTQHVGCDVWLFCDGDGEIMLGDGTKKYSVHMNIGRRDYYRV